MSSTNALYYGDNLHVLRESIASESVDLIYLDPPFNSQATYNVLFKSPTGKRVPGADRGLRGHLALGPGGRERLQSGVAVGEHQRIAEMLRAMRTFLCVRMT